MTVSLPLLAAVAFELELNDEVKAAEIVDKAYAEIKALRADLPPTREQLAALVKPIVWVKSHIDPWDGDYHSVPTEFTIRGQGNEDYRLSFEGGSSWHNSAEAAQSYATQVRLRRLLSAFDIPNAAPDAQRGDG